MPLFEFDDGLNFSTFRSTISETFTDDGVTFVLSVTGVEGSNFSFLPAQDGGIVGFDNFFGNTATWVFDVTGPSSISNFAAAGFSMEIATRITGSIQAVFVGDVSNVTVPLTTAGQVVSGIAGSNTEFTEIRFLTSGFSQLRIESMNATLMCYCAGTQIATPEGAVAVEDLRAGDMVLTADGRATEVTWLGRQPVDTRLTHPAAVNPICISAGALAENVPSRDLFVSPDHAIEIDGVLYQASALVNGTSITMVEKMPRDGFTYYHVETAAHELLLAENTPAESFVEMGDLAQGFENLDERRNARRVSEMALPRVADRRLVPAALREKLRLRAAKLAAAIAKVA
ncbi:Hint domain-containing protein [Tropicibacter sp. R15_0]|uniref:Hint domain-containing protein n=1 Tax=Tropicibacter sp. R15_0 TaxID=2821101 RepID=UPI001ADB6AE7|nr:Hint domain-containing protein [Tropicibacter sp. R15_0]MBO9467962.1 Hint domain-containing protein [Tropicibacter sp. R15_0]